MRNFGSLILASAVQANAAQAEQRLLDESLFSIYINAVAGTRQIDTATAVGTITGDGNATATVTGAGITGSPVAVPVAVLNGDTPAQWAAKVAAALNLNAAISALYLAESNGAAITLTRKAAAANDATLNLALANGTCTGITAAPTSADTLAGAASGVGLTVNIEFLSPNGDWHQAVAPVALVAAGIQPMVRIEHSGVAIRSRISGWTAGQVTVTAVKAAY